jgi:hypothetical protein
MLLQQRNFPSEGWTWEGVHGSRLRTLGRELQALGGLEYGLAGVLKGNAPLASWNLPWWGEIQPEEDWSGTI